MLPCARGCIGGEGPGYLWAKATFSFVTARPAGEGRRRAQARGVKFGRPSKLNAHQRREAIERLRSGETQAEIARTYGVDATTIGRLDCSPA